LGDFLPLDAGMEIHGPVDKEVISFQFDSRKVSKGIAFVARKGVYQDGHKYIDSAIALGCELVVCEELPAILDPHVTYIKCRSVHDFLAKILPVFYDIDFKNIVIVGVTGTNGKTTVATLLYQLFSTLGYTCGLISTVEVRIGKDIFPSTHTTPDHMQYISNGFMAYLLRLEFLQILLMTILIIIRPLKITWKLKSVFLINWILVQ
jgi:UDP-N-acetylmuramoyl-L-alanyl-D-glutamate--2,6-diaminopimelate ligase